jgi:hypothetical protein
MPVTINGKEFYRTAEACQMVGDKQEHFSTLGKGWNIHRCRAS